MQSTARSEPQASEGGPLPGLGRRCYKSSMTFEPRDPTLAEDPSDRKAAYQPPSFEVLSLDCEITAYAPDGDDPLF